MADIPVPLRGSPNVRTSEVLRAEPASSGKEDARYFQLCYFATNICKENNDSINPISSDCKEAIE